VELENQLPPLTNLNLLGLPLLKRWYTFFGWGDFGEKRILQT